MTYRRDRRLFAAPAPDLRLLPWESPEGKPCFLRPADNGGGLVSRLADDVEEAQMNLGTDALTDAEAVLDDPMAGPLTLRVTLRRTAGALGDVLRIADSRGARLPDPGREEEDDGLE
ncbi:hypothetical protein [Streptomyces flaveus]|uniref:Uncharacterized protein n=1 Tax=Streptomyces flaveus TaxID=66370 RepID=A0A917VG56_9ACTN|nr:hypothetical protein [Streptomyces flaveus]GGK73382.1 hypothetical protein GCM10010094_38040 [Streptomyces flaveus]